MKWQQTGNRKSASQNNICNRDKIMEESKRSIGGTLVDLPIFLDN